MPGFASNLRATDFVLKVGGGKNAQQINSDLKHFTGSFRRNLKNIEDLFPAALFDATRLVFASSQRLVPVETGALKRSGYHNLRGDRKRPVVEMGYARRNIPRYATFVHERLNARHKAPTRSKFLQFAYDRWRPHASREVGRILNELASGKRRKIRTARIVVDGVPYKDVNDATKEAVRSALRTQAQQVAQLAALRPLQLRGRELAAATKQILG